MEPDLERCHLEQQAAADLLRSGHADTRGLRQAVEDWLAEEALIEGGGRVRMRYLSDEDVQKIRAEHGWNEAVAKSFLSVSQIEEIRSGGRKKRGGRPGKHGGDGSAEYRCWLGMKQRCYDPRHTGFKHYGKRGITICERWLNSYESFLKDMGRKPSPAHSIERINNDGHYEFSNCRWATQTEQNNNKRNNRKYAASFSVAEWANLTGLPEQLIRSRLSTGWSVEKAVTVKDAPRGGWQTHRFTFRGQTLPLRTWAEVVGLHRSTIYHRLKKGWTFEKVVTTPARSQRKLSPRKPQ